MSSGTKANSSSPNGVAAVANPTTWLTPQQASAYAKCDVVTLRRAVQRGVLIAFRVNGGRRVRYRAEDLDRWLSACPVAVPR